MLYPRSCMVVTQSRAPAPRVPLAKVSLEQGAGGSCPVLPSLHPFPSSNSQRFSGSALFPFQSLSFPPR